MAEYIQTTACFDDDAVSSDMTMSYANSTAVLEESVSDQEDVGQSINVDANADQLSSAIVNSIQGMRELLKDYEDFLTRMQSETLNRWNVRIQCLDKLTEAAIETRDELIQQKANQMKNIHLLASALHGLSNSDSTIAPED